MKISENKLNLALAPASISMVFAMIHTGFWCIGTIAFLDTTINDSVDNLPGLILSVVCVCLGILWIRSAKKKKNFVNQCRKYFASLDGHTRISVNEFASILNEDPGKVRENMTTMITRGYIEGVTLNVRDDHINVHTQAQSQPQLKYQPQPQQQITRKVVSVPVTCESCMGITMLPVNSEGICDYCGSKIKS